MKSTIGLKIIKTIARFLISAFGRGYTDGINNCFFELFDFGLEIHITFSGEITIYLSNFSDITNIISKRFNY